MKYLRLILTVLITISVPLSAFSTENEGAKETPYNVAVRLQSYYETVKSLTFHFTQRTESALGGRPQAGSGEAIFLKDDKSGKMRWNYSTPDQQVLVSDGVAFSMYFSKLKQMIVSPAASMESDLTYAFFTGAGSIPEDFLIFAADETIGADSLDGNIKVIKLVPKEVQSQVNNIHLWITTDSLIQRIEIQDHFDTTTTLNLSNIKTDSLITMTEQEIKNIFSFVPPEDTEIIEQ